MSTNSVDQAARISEPSALTMQETAFLKTFCLTFQAIKFQQFEGMSATGAMVPRGLTSVACNEVVRGAENIGQDGNPPGQNIDEAAGPRVTTTPVEGSLYALGEDRRMSRAGKSTQRAEVEEQ